MKRLAAVLTLAAAPALALAQHPSDQFGQTTPADQAPVTGEVQILEVKETSPYGSDKPMVVKVVNNSKYYLDRVVMSCNVTDDTGRRLFKDLEFQSSKSFSVQGGTLIPRFTKTEVGIAPGTTVQLGMYTENNRWSRGFGKYTYDCRLTAVGGQN